MKYYRNQPHDTLIFLKLSPTVLQEADGKHNIQTRQKPQHPTTNK